MLVWLFVMSENYISYLRVSTKKQGIDGLGVDAQKSTVERFLSTAKGNHIQQYVEVESGKNSDRKELQKAIRDCRLKNAKLVVSKLDRLSRDLHFITSLQKSGVKFVVAEQPEMNELTVHIFAAMAEHEVKMISQRTKAALKAAKERGVTLGNPNLKQVRNTDTTQAREARQIKANDYANDMGRVIMEIQSNLDQPTLNEIADALNAMSYKTVRGSDFKAMTVKRTLDRYHQLNPA